MKPSGNRYICIEGNIGAGKTTLTNRLARAWQCPVILEQFTDNPFLPLFYENPERYGFQVELFFMVERHKQLLEINPNQSLFDEVLVADYIFNKTLLFAGQNLKKHEFTLFKHLYDVMAKTAPVPDLIIYLHRSVDKIYHQIKQRGRSIEKSVQKEYLTRIQDAYFEYFKHEVHFPIVILDVEDLDFGSNEKHFNMVREWVEKEYQPGVHRVRLVS